METSLILVILSSLLFGVNCNCNFKESEAEVMRILNSTNVCTSPQVQAAAVAALRKCLVLDDDIHTPCPPEVRNNASSLVIEIEGKFSSCGDSLRHRGRASCEGLEIFACFNGLADLPSLGDLSSFQNIASTCPEIKKLLNTLNVCKSCIGNLFGGAWKEVQDDVENTWAMVNEFINGACECAARIENAVNTVDEGSTCKYVEDISRSIEEIAEKCVLDLVGSVQEFEWLSITREYLNTIAVFSNNACRFTGGDSDTEEPQPAQHTTIRFRPISPPTRNPNYVAITNAKPTSEQVSSNANMLTASVMMALFTSVMLVTNLRKMHL